MLLTVGVWMWGVITVLLAALFLFVVLAAGFFIEKGAGEYAFKDAAPRYLIGLFYSVKDQGSLVAGIIGFSGLAWSIFFKVYKTCP